MPDPNTQDQNAQPDSQDPAGNPPAADPGTGAPNAQDANQGRDAQASKPSDLNQVVDMLKSLGTRLDGVEASLRPSPQPAGAGAAEPAPSDDDDIEKEIRQREDQLIAIQRGELGPEYEPQVRRLHSEAVARKVGREMVAHESARGNFVNQYNQHLAQAYQEYPELKDPNSELTKETVRILSLDPQHGKIHEAIKAKGRQLEKIDFSVFDSRINLRAVREADAIIRKRNAGKPITQQNPRLAKTGLEPGAGSPPPGEDEVARLEKEAAESVDPGAWRRLIKAQDQRQKARQQTV